MILPQTLLFKASSVASPPEDPREVLQYSINFGDR